LSRYARHKSTRVLMGAYSFNGGSVRQWDAAQGERMPSEVKEALLDPGVRKIAWNAAFEIAITLDTLGLDTPITSWRCAMVLAMSLSLPAKLERAGRAIGLPQDKQKMREGKSLVTYFTQPRKRLTKTKQYPWNTHETDPKKWEKFKEYNRQDVIAESEIYERCLPWDLPAEEWDLWHLDQEINRKGIPVNTDYVGKALDIIDHVRGKYLDRAERITGLENVESGDQLLPWLQDRGYKFNDLKKGHIRRAAEEWRNGDDTKLKKMLDIRAEISKSSVKKYQAFYDLTDMDGLYRYSVQYSGAGRTMRWSGRGAQVQNLTRPAAWLEKPALIETLVRHINILKPRDFDLIYQPPMEAMSTGVRPCIQAPEGKLFGDADLNAIENRVLGWMAMDQRILGVFKKDRDPYLDFAQYMYESNYDDLLAEYKRGEKKKRTISKPPVLGCGYMLSGGTEYEDEQTGEIVGTGLLGYAWNMGVKMTLDESTRAVEIWRKTFKDVVEFWKAIMKAAMRCVRYGERTHCEVVSFDMDGPFLRMRLPSGRHIHYYKPLIRQKKTPWGEMRPTLTYLGENDKGQWIELTTHPGKVTENADQAISRDLLAHGIVNAKRAGLDVRFHVHDQIIVLSKEDRAEAELKKLIECMVDQPKWARDLPLKANGSVSKVFMKD